MYCFVRGVISNCGRFIYYIFFWDFRGIRFLRRKVEKGLEDLVLGREVLIRILILDRRRFRVGV